MCAHQVSIDKQVPSSQTPTSSSHTPHRLSIHHPHLGIPTPHHHNPSQSRVSSIFLSSGLAPNSPLLVKMASFGLLQSPPLDDNSAPPLSVTNNNNNNAMAPPPPPRTLAAPPSGTYPTREAALTFLKNWAAPQGYAVVIKRSRPNRLWIRCDRGGSHISRPPSTNPRTGRVRKHRESRLMGCPFKVVIVYKGETDSWITRTEIPDHNHGPSEDLSEHPTLRRMTAEQTRKMEELADREYTPQETLDELKRIWPDIHVVNRDLYNARKKYKTQKTQRDSDVHTSAAGDTPSAIEGDIDPQRQQDNQLEAQLRANCVDPNGVFPGPTPYGKWVWVTDAHEVVKKPKYKRKRDRMLEHQAQDGNTSTAAGAGAAEEGGNSSMQIDSPTTPHLSSSSLGIAPVANMSRGGGGPSSTMQPNGQQPEHLPNGISSPSSPLSPTNNNTNPNQNYDPALLDPSSQQLLQAQAAATQLAQFMQQNHAAQQREAQAQMQQHQRQQQGQQESQQQEGGGGAEGAGQEAGQEGEETRLEKLEREQRNTQTMLNQILGAVQGMRRS